MSIYGALQEKIARREVVCGVVGMGYVGLPLAVGDGEERAACDRFREIAVRVSTRCGRARATSRTWRAGDVAELRRRKLLDMHAGHGAGSPSATSSRSAYRRRSERPRIPTCRYIVSATEAVAAALRPGQLIVLESTTYPGTTRELMLPLLEQRGLHAGEDFFLCFSPERVDPGNERWHTKNTPKVLGGITRPVHGARDRRLRDLHRPHGAGVVARGRRADEAAREHVPHDQHRSCERDGPDLRQAGRERVGGHRRRSDEAVRLHEVHAGPRTRRALHSARPALPRVEDADAARTRRE